MSTNVTSPISTLHENSWDRGEIDNVVEENITPANIEKVLAQNVDEQQELKDETATIESQPEPAYSIFTPNQKRFIVFIAAWAGFFSSIAATIYFPALNALARDLHVSSSLINLTLTSYMIFQGLAPPLMGNFADTAGRRPAYFLCFTIFIAANIGLALQSSYASLFVLRCLQSAGSSATIAMASAVVADIAPPAQRGKYMGWTTGGILISAAMGPILGGVLTEFLGWRAIFWFLAIFSSVFFVVFGVFFPETARSKVGNGSIMPTGFNMSLVNYLAIRKARRTNDSDSQLSQSNGDASNTMTRPKKTRMDPFAAVKILLEIEGAFVLLSNASVFMAFYFVTATIPSQFEKKYRYNDLQIGLCYIPWGCGTLISSLVAGPVTDKNFKRHCTKLGLNIRKGRDQDLSDFPIERARLEIALPALYVMSVLLLVFGWVLHINGPVPVLLILLFLSAFATSFVFNNVNTLLIDLYPKSPATATAANNFVRCLLGAGGTAVVIPMINAIGTGWTYTILSVFLIATSPMAWILMSKGIGWRKKQARKEWEKAEKNARNVREGNSEEGEVLEVQVIEKAPSNLKKTPANGEIADVGASKRVSDNMTQRIIR